MVIGCRFLTQQTQSEILKGLIDFAQDEIWSEVVLKRIKSLRENTKAGCFGSIPYSFMTSSMRSRYMQMLCPALFM